MSGLVLWSGVVLAAAIVVVALSVWAARRSRPDSAGPDPTYAARLVFVLAVIGAALSVISLVVSVLQSVFAEEVAVTVPVQGFVPPLDYSVFDLQGPTAEAVPSSAGFTEAALVVIGLDGWARAWLAAGHAVNGAVIVALMLIIAGLARQAMRAEPFATRVSGRLGIGGAALAVGSLVWQAAYGIGGSLASAQVFGATSWASRGEVATRYADAGLADTGLPVPAFAFEIEFWPIGVGLALIVLAGLMRSAERLQRETAGLV